MLESKHIELLRAFPFWSLARSMEQEADRMIAIYAKTVTDPVIREAIELQGYEEGRPRPAALNTMLESVQHQRAVGAAFRRCRSNATTS